jgi:hypothetical protein
VHRHTVYQIANRLAKETGAARQQVARPVRLEWLEGDGRTGGRIMARGWESKSVEAQIQDNPRLDRGQPLTPEQRRLRQQVTGLELSRRRVLQELAGTRSDLRRRSLEQALAFLDQQLAELRPLAP